MTGAARRIGRRLLVIPADTVASAADDQVIIRLGAGAAFGDGAHPTTQLCLAALERQARILARPAADGRQWALIDLGAGTGILSIAAAQLGARPILAVDIDAQAVAEAHKNVALNQVTAAVRVEQVSLTEVRDGRYGPTQAPVVVANILANVLVAFFDRGLVDTVTPGGLLILSGILRTQGPEIRARLGWHGLTLAAEEKKEDWLCLVARRSHL